MRASSPSTATQRRSPRSRGVANVETRALDLEGDAWPLAGERFDAIVVTNYLHRPLFAALLDALADDGVLLYETFAAATRRTAGRRTPLSCCERDELAANGCVADSSVVAFEQGASSKARAPPSSSGWPRSGAAARGRPPLPVSERSGSEHRQRARMG